ncbi:MAG: 2Fe-2S iron-sulfur cluster binding domain-containing protein [Phycisphaerales bacterium]|jgi:ferredoxin|nr:2Fe-2S iron-sulfur cluster binding domain-containing protein [Phycisphaerales bacterium]MBT7171407.1 2Fe-2S iron-sulfur cluster binding domain-containing protein [Phycisphaerales bacterium]
MPHFLLDNQRIEFRDGETVLQAAARHGVTIPHLCWKDGCDARTSCMVCLVRRCDTGAFVPSCALPAAEGLAVESETPDVLAMRREAMELLLGDHLGDCEAPCRKAHPASLDIPAILRVVATDELDLAATILSNSAGALATLDETKYEKACRRARHDAPVNIAGILQFLAAKTGATESPAAVTPKTRLSTTIPISAIDLPTAVKATAADRPRNETIDSLDDAMAEAARCMHCDCRDAKDCSLRLWAEHLDANPNARKAPHRQWQLVVGEHAVFEPGKCIQCGLCVEVANSHGKDLGPTWHGRGFDLSAAAPLGRNATDPFNDPALAAALIEACPTGAIAK